MGLLLLASAGLAAGLALFDPHHLSEAGGDGPRLAGMVLAYTLYLLGFLAWRWRSRREHTARERPWSACWYSGCSIVFSCRGG